MHRFFLVHTLCPGDSQLQTSHPRNEHRMTRTSDSSKKFFFSLIISLNNNTLAHYWKKERNHGSKAQGAWGKFKFRRSYTNGQMPFTGIYSSLCHRSHRSALLRTTKIHDGRAQNRPCAEQLACRPLDCSLRARRQSARVHPFNSICMVFEAVLRAAFWMVGHAPLNSPPSKPTEDHFT